MHSCIVYNFYQTVRAGSTSAVENWVLPFDLLKVVLHSKLKDVFHQSHMNELAWERLRGICVNIKKI